MGNKPCMSGEVDLRTSASDCKWCHPQALEMCKGGKWSPFAVLHYSRTSPPLEHSLPQPPLPFRLHCTSAKIISAPGLRGLLSDRRRPVNSGQMWGDMGRGDAVGSSESGGGGGGNCGASDVFSWQHGDLEHLSVLVLVDLCFLHSFRVFDLMCRHGDYLVSAWCHGPQWRLES